MIVDKVPSNYKNAFNGMLKRLSIASDESHIVTWTRLVVHSETAIDTCRHFKLPVNLNSDDTAFEMDQQEED